MICEEVEGPLFMGWGHLRTRKNVIDDRATSPGVWGQKGQNQGFLQGIQNYATVVHLAALSA